MKEIPLDTFSCVRNAIMESEATTKPTTEKRKGEHTTMNDTKELLRRYCENVRDELQAVCDNQRNGEEDGDIYDYVADALDVEYHLNSRLELMGVKLYVTLGGPNVWINTYTRYVEGAWGADTWSTPLDSDICEELDQYFEEELRCRGLA